jgi:nitrate reductase cytochrome c-type subunit
MPLTDSMSAKYHATIKRVSDKNRNPNNKANAEELVYIEQFKKQLASKKEPKPVMVDKGETVQFYYPIPTNTMCLQCHGKPNDINPAVRAKTLKLYPNDLAIGYGENEVRGIWSITFNKN